ncbi:hypothetical protein C8T65DRAFT_647267 [Cerioporus squamosus]|nr:hypothetical protein C8T65DRAFT_647267 [Cerioporus squamosus]
MSSRAARHVYHGNLSWFHLDSPPRPSSNAHPAHQRISSDIDIPAIRVEERALWTLNQRGSRAVTCGVAGMKEAMASKGRQWW